MHTAAQSLFLVVSVCVVCCCCCVLFFFRQEEETPVAAGIATRLSHFSLTSQFELFFSAAQAEKKKKRSPVQEEVCTIIQ